MPGHAEFTYQDEDCYNACFVFTQATSAKKNNKKIISMLANNQ